MVSVFRVTVDDSEVRRLYKDVLRYVNMEVPRLTKNQALEGARFARRIAPHQTGALIQAIDMAPGRSDKEWRVVSRTPKRSRNRPYHYYLNLGKRGWAEGISTRSGEYRYMQATFEHLRGRYFEDVVNEFNKTIR